MVEYMRPVTAESLEARMDEARLTTQVLGSAHGDLWAKLSVRSLADVF